jgi:transposase
MTQIDLRALVNQQGAWGQHAAETHPICFSPYLYRACNLVERFFNKIKHSVGVSLPDMTSSQPTISPTSIKLASIRI